MKVFGIGFGRTGTTSLTRALTMLGLSAKHYPSPKVNFDHFDALTDITVTARWRELDQQYPGAKFILTVREMEAWLDSCRRFFPLKKIRPWWAYVARYRCYRTIIFQEKMYRAAAIRHEAEVRKYFAGRPDDLLIMDVCAGDGWDKLCPFLSLPVPDQPFPHDNVGRQKDKTALSR